MADYKIINDYTLQETTLLSQGGITLPRGDIRMTMVRIFNFAAGKATTIVRDQIVAYQYNNDGGCGTSTSIQVTQENFSDMASPLELQILHKKLSDLGGTPPPLEDIGIRPLDKAKPSLQRQTP